MKNMPLLLILLINSVISISIASLCMENNDHIGCIDTLMLFRSILNQGYKTIQQDIKDHPFNVSQWSNITPHRYITRLNPYCITHRCKENDDSALSDQVFDRIYKKVSAQITIEIKNPFNSHSNAIDHCTIWEPITNSTDVYAIATFYHKAALVKTLKRLHK